MPVNETLRSLSLENCIGLGASIPLPKEWVDAEAPDAFRTFGSTGLTSDVTVFAHRCARIVVPGKVLTDQSLLILAPISHTKNEAWEPIAGPSFYLWDVFVSSPELGAVLRSWGFPSRTATFEIRDTDPSMKSWDVKDNDTHVSFEYRVSSQLSETQNATNYFWTGSDPFIRLNAGVNYTHMLVGTSTLQHGSVQFEGPSRTASIVKSPAAAWQGSAYSRVDRTFTLDPSIFYGEKP